MLNNLEQWLTKLKQALAGVAQWIGYWLASWKVAGSIPSQGTCLGCGPGPQLGPVRGNRSMYLSHIAVSLFSLPSLLNVNKILNPKTWIANGGRADSTLRLPQAIIHVLEKCRSEQEFSVGKAVVCRRLVRSRGACAESWRTPSHSGLTLPKTTEMLTVQQRVKEGPLTCTSPPLAPTSVTGLEGFSEHSKVLM